MFYLINKLVMKYTFGKLNALTLNECKNAIYMNVYPLIKPIHGSNGLKLVGFIQCIKIHVAN